jgi:hypothetical protein
MIFISHRGNTTGRIESQENNPTYIDKAISEGYDVEVDVWYEDNNLFLGHDKPEYGVNLQWFKDRQSKLWVHCKNTEALVFFKNINENLNYFWHENDTITLTSQNYIWAFPGKQPIENSIAVMPEIFNDNTLKAIGICSDLIKNYKQ